MRGSDGGMTLKVGRFKGRLRHPINPNIAPNANGDNGENRSNGDNGNIGANGDNDDIKETRR